MSGPGRCRAAASNSVSTRTWADEEYGVGGGRRTCATRLPARPRRRALAATAPPLRPGPRGRARVRRYARRGDGRPPAARARAGPWAAGCVAVAYVERAGG